jgi:hypothetical protein
MREQRSAARRHVSGRAYWSAGRRDGACAIRDLSAVGACIENAPSALRIGDWLQMTLEVADRLLPPLRAQVVWLGHRRRAGLRFESPSQELAVALRALVTADRIGPGASVEGSRS